MRLTLLPALAFAIAGCATVSSEEEYDFSQAVSVQEPVSAATTTDAVDPAIWLVRDADTSIYLLGTFHLLPPDYEWRTPVIDAAIANAQTLVVETRIDPENPADLALLMQDLGFTPGLPPLEQRVAAEYRPRLRQLVSQSGAPIAAFDRMESWTAGLTLFSLQATTLGIEEGAGVETDLVAAFTAAGKSVDQLETNAEQLAFFDNLSPDAQRQFLESVLEDPETLKADFAEMLRAWTRGDVEATAAAFNGDYARGTELYRTLLTQRNRNWATWIQRRMSQPGTALVAVGAGHLAGPESLVAMLEAGGQQVLRIDD